MGYLLWQSSFSFLGAATVCLAGLCIFRRLVMFPLLLLKIRAMHVLMFQLPAPFTWETNVQLPEFLMPDHLFSYLQILTHLTRWYLCLALPLCCITVLARPYLHIPDVVLFIFPSILVFVSFLVIVFLNFYLFNFNTYNKEQEIAPTVAGKKNYS